MCGLGHTTQTMWRRAWRSYAFRSDCRRIPRSKFVLMGFCCVLRFGTTTTLERCRGTLRVTVPSPPPPPITRQGTHDTKQESEHKGVKNT